MLKRWQIQASVVTTAAVLWAATASLQPERQWLAGDSHIHSHWSARYDTTKDPPDIILGDGAYTTPINAQRARQYGLSWMVTTDHGGPTHSKLNLERAYAELRTSREMVPDLLQFYGMELNMPAMDHHTLIIPNSEREAAMLYDIESQFDAQDAWPRDPMRNQESQARRAVEYMKGLPLLPLVFANHPSRSAKGLRAYGLDEPRELRANNDVAPDVYRGMEGAPGHQAATRARDGSAKRNAAGEPVGFRGSYNNAGAHTLGGFDQMTAIVGGLWDSLLGEGRRFWIVATSDSHANYADPSRAGSDFWPGEYQKTYVHAAKTYSGVLDGLRTGRIFAAAGDLISELDLEARGGAQTAGIGGTLVVEQGQPITVTIRFRDPEATNAHGDNPRVARVDLIMGEVRGRSEDATADTNPTTQVVGRFTAKEWACKGDTCTIIAMLPSVERPVYVRVRGTSTQDLEPAMDVVGEDPWSDLWFYSNPVFVEFGAARR